MTIRELIDSGLFQVINQGEDLDRTVESVFCCDLLSIAMGKAPAGVAAMAKQYGALVLAFAGSVTEDAGACNQAGIDAFFPIVRGDRKSVV